MKDIGQEIISPTMSVLTVVITVIMTICGVMFAAGKVDSRLHAVEEKCEDIDKIRTDVSYIKAWVDIKKTAAIEINEKEPFSIACR